MDTVMTTHQELEHLEATAIVLGNMMNTAGNLPPDKKTFDAWYLELHDFVGKTNEKKLEFILSEYDRKKPSPENGNYQPLFRHYIMAILDMRDELYRLKAINRAYITQPQNNERTFIGEYEIRGTSFYIKHPVTKQDVKLELSPQAKEIFNGFLTKHDDHTLTMPEVAEITHSDALDTKLISGQVDKLNRMLFLYHHKRVIRNTGRSVKPLTYKLYLASEFIELDR